MKGFVQGADRQQIRLMSIALDGFEVFRQVGKHANVFAPIRSDVGKSDMLSLRGAMRLARRLEKYWHNEGYPAARF